ncbi:hypothetical protein JZ751_024465 [Albula glossodonta]|uniref:Pseudopodium-enriched atypical kinase 1 n=1 Tax=Albula glossodonta TaxID=121402 RepID=A0A8T2PFR5_9TELE|nr:hypothetical protein JZ751_024465 [Albula glossodonta]
MDSVNNREDRKGYPPPLPVKQRRSLYSRGSSYGSSFGSTFELELEQEACSSLGTQSQTHSLSDVFPTSIDCHAPQCPIHHGPDSIYSHQGRFLSDYKPPVPKKKLIRALSLPGGCLHPQCSLPSRRLNYDNPLYMLTPIKDIQFTEIKEQRAVFESLNPSQHLSLLSFDTPDLQLPCFFKNFQDQGQVSMDIQQCHQLFLRSIAQRMEKSLHGVEPIKEVGSFQPQEFQICEGYQSRKIGGAVFYHVHCQKMPGRVFSAKVYRSSDGSHKAALQKPLPRHANIQQVLAHYPHCLQSEQYTSTENPKAINASTAPQECEHKSPQSPSDDSSMEKQLQVPSSSGHTVLSLLRSGAYEVDIERDMPWATLEDFVEDGISLHQSEPQLYERRLCLLLLQLAQGLQHLHKHAATCAELQPQSIMLAWSERETIEELTEQTGETVTPDTETEIDNKEREGSEGRIQRKVHGEGGDLDTSVQGLWKKWGLPRVVITFQPLPESSQTAAPEKLHFGSLLRFCLHLPENSIPQEPMASLEISQSSPYTQGLLLLASQLLDQESGVQTADVPGVLQALLWGPQAKLFQQNQPESGTTLLGSWLSVKRALLVQKMAELGLSERDRWLDHEDFLCLQYLSLSSPESVLKSITLLQLCCTDR